MMSKAERGETFSSNKYQQRFSNKYYRCDSVQVKIHGGIVNCYFTEVKTRKYVY